MAVRRILLLMDNRGDSNWGSQATTTALVSLLQARFPGAQISGVPRSACRPQGKLVRWYATAMAPRIASTGGPERALKALTESWREEFEKADLVVVNGEGTLHPQPQSLRWVCSVLALAKRHKKPYWVVNCSLRCRGDQDEPIYAEFFGSAQYVAAREPASFREMQAIGARPVQAADCAWLTEPATQEQATQILHKHGVEGDFAVMTGSASVHKWPREHQIEVVHALWKRGLHVVYMHSDAKDAHNVVAMPPDVKRISHKDADFRQMAAIQSLAKVLVGGRFHPTILAALVGTPFVAVPSNTHKMAGLMEMLGAEELLCDFASLQRVVPTIEKVLRDRDEWSFKLRAASQECVKLAPLNVPSG